MRTSLAHFAGAPAQTTYVEDMAQEDHNITQGAGTGLCFIEPRDAIDMMAPTLDEDAKEILVDAAVSAWAGLVPEDELEKHYESALSKLDADDIDSLANWHGMRAERQVVPSAEFLLKLFPTLGSDRREALELASGMRVKAAVYEEELSIDEALEVTLAQLDEDGLMETARVALDLYVIAHAGSEN